MNKKALIVSLIVIVFIASSVFDSREGNLLSIKFGLGKNIHETAKQSGAPRYATRNVAGLVSYKLIDLPPEVALVYDVPGYQITSSPIFAFTLYADEDSNNNLAVEAASLQFNTYAVNSHESAKDFVEQLIAQFHKGGWKRFVPELCPAVTGRSSFLDENEQVNQIWNCPLDPKHKIAMDDWMKLMLMTQNYQWIDHGVLATLTVGFSDDSRGITYSIRLEFDDFSVKTRRERTSEREELEKSDAQGRNSTAKHFAGMVKAKARIIELEKNSIRRGDLLFAK